MKNKILICFLLVSSLIFLHLRVYSELTSDFTIAEKQFDKKQYAEAIENYRHALNKYPIKKFHSQLDISNEVFNKYHNSEGNYTIFPDEVSRRITKLNLKLSYNFTKDSELSVDVLYISSEHTTTQKKLVGNNFGDISIEGFYSLDIFDFFDFAKIGVNCTLPTGTSVWQVNSSTLSTGNGFFNIGPKISLYKKIQELNVLFAIYYLYGFPKKVTKVSGIVIPEADVYPGSIFGFENINSYFIYDNLSLDLTINGLFVNKGAASFVSTSSDATDTITVLSDPQVTLLNKSILTGSFTINYDVIEDLNFYIGVRLPMFVINEYSGINLYTGVKYDL